MDIKSRIVAILEVAGGAALLGIALLSLPVAFQRQDIVSMIFVLLFAAISAYFLVTGFALWRNSHWGWKHSKIVQAILIPVLQLPIVSYQSFLGAGIFVGLFGSSLTVNFNFGGNFNLSFGTQSSGFGFGVNLLAIWCLYALWSAGGPTAEAPDSDTADPSSLR
ncbi:MAG: hypothetical protein AB8G18_09295 [Gammaproteobacteria bacterium]